MMNENYWKDKYKDKWGESSAREEWLKRYIEQHTGKTCEVYGLGACSTQYIPGSAKQNGYRKGDADIWIEGTDIYIEVTGPLSKSTPSSAPLWIRPDKIYNAIENNGHDVFLAHNCASDGTWRTIHLDKGFKCRFSNREFGLIYPVIRGSRETYVQIDAKDPCIHGLQYLVEYIKKSGAPTASTVRSL